MEDGRRLVLRVVVAAASWPPAEAGRDGVPTWAAGAAAAAGWRRWTDCDCAGWRAAACRRRILEISRGETVERLREESAGHGRTCSRGSLAA